MSLGGNLFDIPAHKKVAYRQSDSLQCFKDIQTACLTIENNLRYLCSSAKSVQRLPWVIKGHIDPSPVQANNHRHQGARGTAMYSAPTHWECDLRKHFLLAQALLALLPIVNSILLGQLLLFDGLLGRG